MNWSSGEFHRIQSMKTNCNTRGSIRTQNFCLLALVCSCLFFEIRNTVPNWNLSLLSPGYLLWWQCEELDFVTTFCFHCHWSLATSGAQEYVTSFLGLYLGHSMSSRVALNLFPPLGMDAKGQTRRMEHKTRLNTHFKAPSRLSTSKSFSPTSLQAKELHHINAASVLPGPRKSWDTAG